MFTKDYADAYPNAKVIGIEALLKKRPDIKWTSAFGRDADPLADVPDMKARYFAGFVNQVRAAPATGRASAIAFPMHRRDAQART